MGVAKKLEGNADASDQPGRPVRARAGGDPGHLSPRSPHAAAEADRARAATAQFEPISWDEAIAELVAQLDALAAAGDQKSLAFLTRPRRGQRERAARRSSLEKFGAPPPIVYELFGDDVLRRANAMSFGREQLPTFDLAQRAFRRSVSAPTSSAPGTRRSRRAPPTARCGRAARACAARSSRSNRGCR